MAERISLEVPATLSALSTVRMVVGGLGARLDFSLEDLDDLYLALDRLLEAALDAEELPAIRVLVHLEDGTLRVSAGAFRSRELRDQISVTPGDCIDLCIMLAASASCSPSTGRRRPRERARREKGQRPA
jgi:hypothetical protein